MIAGMDPQIASGHRSYVQAHALAAARAGFAPQIFYAGRIDEVTAADYGVLHRVATPLRHPHFALVYRRAIAAAVADYVERDGREGTYGVHGFGPWVGTSVLACKMLGARGVQAVPLASAYTTVAHEWRALLHGLRVRDGAASRSYLGWYPWMRLLGARAERDGYRRSRVVFVNYESVRRLVEQTCGGGAAEIRSLPYAAPAAFHPAPVCEVVSLPAEIAALEPASAPLIVCVSRHDPRKGNAVLLDALAQLRDVGVQYRACLVGGGRLLSAHQRRARELGLERSVCLTGRVNDALGYLCHGDIFVLPSLEEGSGSVSLLEALQLGKAVIASRCDGIPEDLIDGEDAVLVTPGDERELADALASLLGDAARRAELGARSAELFRRRFTADGFVSSLADAYHQLGLDP
jgi:glycosyltransferase involved in cell wall biosynthesis